MSAVNECCRAAKAACGYLAQCPSGVKNAMLEIVAQSLLDETDTILQGNALDLAAAQDKPEHFLDRLALDATRICGIGEGVRALIALDDPVGEIKESWTTDTGLNIVKVRVPLGVVGIIYEARPNVTVDAIALCIKTGNAVVLRGSKDALQSNRAIVGAIRSALEKNGYRSDFIQLIEDTTHAGADALMKCREFVDVLIPRGSAALIRTVVDNASVPVIETGAGNCHAYVEKTADLHMAKEILLNGKLQRPSVCNALEKLLIDRDIAPTALPVLVAELQHHGVEVRGCAETCALCGGVVPATDSDFYTEYNALTIAVKVVGACDEAITWINAHGTHHSEVIVTQDSAVTEKFLNGVDSAAVYVNASTRFMDGFEFGFGAEMGISTQKLHARGPLGLRQLTSEKYKIYGQGQTRK